MSAAQCMMLDNSFWLNRRQIEDAERDYYVRISCPAVQSDTSHQAGDVPAASGDAQLVQRIAEVEQENRQLRKITSDLQSAIDRLDDRIKTLEVSGAKQSSAPVQAEAPASKAAVADDSDDDLDLFGSDDEDEKAEAERIREERLKAYAEKKAKKPQVIAKSNIILDIKPWDDETDMAEMERQVRAIEMDGLLWGASKLVPVGYGIKKLQITTVVEDDKVSVDDLEDRVTAIEDYVQSMDIAAFNKI